MRALRAIQLTAKIFHWAMMLEGVRARARESKRSIVKRAATHAKARAKRRRKDRPLLGKMLFGNKASRRRLFGRAVAA